MYTLLMMVSLNAYLAASEFQIKGNPSYLYRSFDNIREDIFPSDFAITLSLSRVAGMLFYSFDKNSHQLILSINDAFSPTLDIEFNREHKYVSLTELCLCKLCRYEKLKLRIQIREQIHLQCNAGKSELYKFEYSKNLNKDYPIPKFNNTPGNDAKLWLINTPFMDGIYPNGVQMTGCIFETLYKNVPIAMESHGLADKCPITCTPGICNSGTCLETYNNYPVCNCTSSFQNGQYCNDSLIERNREIPQKVQLGVLKLSFNSTSKDILDMKNELFGIFLLAEGKDLILKIKCRKLYRTEIRITITNNYLQQDNNIIILSFGDKNINLTYKSSSTDWVHIDTPHFHDISREFFDIIKIQSGRGRFDLVYKSDIKTLKWRTFEFKEPKETTMPQQNSNVKTTSSPLLKVNTAQESILSAKQGRLDSNVYINIKQSLNNLQWKVEILFALSIVSMFMILIGVILFLYCHKKIPYGKRKRSSDEGFIYSISDPKIELYNT